jgi:hydroxyacylglutathione hydrolase
MIRLAGFYLMFQRFFDEGLAQASYLIACERTREAAVVDPRRDVDVYVEAAARHGLRLACAIETHTHADFVSGARELSALGARVVAGPGADLQFPYHEAAGGESLQVGDIAIEILHTPGHTPEHICAVVREPGSPVRVLTGDTLFVGAVGRPDLLGPEQMRALADALHASLFGPLLALDDAVEVHPGHGAGSLCGAGIGHEPHSTIGRERRFNPLLQLKSRAEFVDAVLGDLPETPPYFARMKRVNRQGPPLQELARGVPAARPLVVRDAAALLEDGALLLDMRSPDAFAAGHPAGALNLGFGPRIGYWAGWLVPAGSKLVLLASDPAETMEAVRQLLRVGLDEVCGYLDGGFEAWRLAGAAISTVELLSARQLRDRSRLGTRQTIVDVRTRREWEAGHIDGAVNIPLGDLPDRAAELRGGPPAVTVCESGYRASLAASLLLRAGVEVVNVRDGTSAYRLLEAARPASL